MVKILGILVSMVVLMFGCAPPQEEKAQTVSLGTPEAQMLGDLLDQRTCYRCSCVNPQTPASCVCNPDNPTLYIMKGNNADLCQNCQLPPCNNPFGE